MITILLRQPKNIWKTLGLLHKIEIILLGGMICTYLVTRFIPTFKNWLSAGQFSAFELNALILHSVTFIILISAPFIFLYLLPRQKDLHVFYTKPLSKTDTLLTLGFYYHKYQTAPILFFLPLLIALGILDPVSALFSLILFVIYDIVIYLLIFCLFIQTRNKKSFLFNSFILIIIHTLLVNLFVFYHPLIWYFDIAFILLSGFVIKRFFILADPFHIESIYPLTEQIYKMRTAGNWSFRSIPRFLPAPVQSLFNKELLGLWRNPQYRKLKLFTIFIYSVILLLLSIANVEYKEMWMAIFSAVIIWLHYSNHFNDKYILPEPEWYFRSLPLRFSQVWISKIAVELLFIFILLIIQWAFLLFLKLDINAQMNIIGLLFFFSMIILLTMLNFQIMFYNDPRLAGYAYHFTIIFFVVMSINFRFVGPVITLFMIGYYFYKNYRFFYS